MKKLDLQIDDQCGECQRLFQRIQEIQRTQHTERKGTMDGNAKLWVSVVLAPDYNLAGLVSCWHIESVYEKRKRGSETMKETKFICAINHDCLTCDDNDKCPEGKEKERKKP